jgi:hypothetical protein
MKHLVTVTVISFCTFALSGVALAEDQTFDSGAAASAAGWTEFGSRDNNFNFGFSDTNDAEGASAGEGGGVVARSEPTSYYGDLTIGAGDLSTDLNATGRLKFQDSAFDGEFFFGWFDRVGAEADGTRDYLGIHVREPRDDLWRVNSSIDGSDGAQMDIPSGLALNFEIGWDADGGAAAGDGLLTVSLNSLDGSTTFASTVEGFDGSNLNAFGLLSNAQSGEVNQVGSFWFDDVSYSQIPEPSTSLLAIWGLSGLMFARRKRK